MSGIINKVKDALHHDSSTSSTSHETSSYSTDAPSNRTGIPEGTAGPHTSRVANAADPRVDSDLDGSGRYSGTTGVGHTSHTGHTGHTGGAAMTGSAVGAGVGSGVEHSGLHSGGAYGSTNVGSHSSRIANSADPRVDSTTGAHTVGSNTGTGYDSTGYGSTGAGPHSSGVANTVDPRVDSTTGAHTIGSNAGGTSHGINSAAYGSSTTTGPHSSNIANTVDPRVDSTTGTNTIGSNTAGAGYGTTGAAYGNTDKTGFSSSHSHSTNAGPHNSNIANKADPRVDSDLDGRGQRHAAGGAYATPGSGSAQNTAGPHDSDLLNKLDPRVDSNRDGSSTLGSNRTYATHKDHRDAAAVPPSIMRESIGQPQVLHNDTKHNHSGRHGSISTRDDYKGL